MPTLKRQYHQRHMAWLNMRVASCGIGKTQMKNEMAISAAATAKAAYDGVSGWRVKQQSVAAAAAAKMLSAAAKHRSVA